MKIKYSLCFILLTLLATVVNAQNDDPCSATTLTVGATCASITGNNTGATNSAIPDVPCDGGSSEGDIWFSADIPAGGSVTIITNPGTLTDVGMAIYIGNDCNSLSLHSCIAGGNQSASAMPIKTLTGMTPGSTVWIRIWDVDNNETGTFDICALTCNASVSITGPTTGCSADINQICATAGFSTYLWGNGVTTQCKNVTNTLTYTVVVSDANGCTASATHAFTGYTSPTVNITGPATGCTANNVQLCVPNTFSNYSWSNGDTQACMNPGTTGNYSITVTDGNGCTATDAHSITIHTSPTVSITGPPSKCSGASDQLCVPNTFSGYSWSSGEFTNCITPNSSGTYTVIVSDAFNCTATAAQAITVQTSPAITVTGSANACPNTNAQLCAPNGYNSYLWSNGATTTCIAPSSSGTYTATVTNGFGCTGNDDFTINIYASPNVSITGPSSVCNGSTGTLCATAGFADYNWSNGSTTNCTSAGTAGTYTVIVTDVNSCTNSDSRVFTIDSLPASTITGPSLSCNGNAATLCAPAGSSSYLWSNGNTNSCITTSSSGNYTVTVTGTNSCTSSSSKALSVVAPFAMTVTGPSTACSGSNPQLCASAGSFTYQWSNGATTACINPSVSGTYTVIATSVSGCTKSASKGLTVYSPLNATITGPSSACIGSNVPLCGPAGANSYVWSNGFTTDCINVNNNGTYTVTISDIHNCTASATQAVTFSNNFNVDISGPPSGCIGTTTTLCVPSGYTNYAWSTGDTTECITVNTAGNYSVTIHDPVGCVANSFFNLVYNQPPVVNITGEVKICTGTTTSWCATPGYSDYIWTNGGTDACINVSDDTAYTVEATDSNGCASTATATLQIILISPSIYLAPNGELVCDTFNTNFTYTWLLNGSPNGCNGDSCSPTFTGTYTVIVTDAPTNCSESATFSYIQNGVNDPHVNNNISVYPNPFNGDQFNIDFVNMSSEKTTIEIFNAIGNRVMSEDISISSSEFTKTITLPSKATGFYFVYLRTKSGVIVKRILSN